MMDTFEILRSNIAKINFLKGLIRIAKSDGVDDKAEIMFFQQAAEAMGLQEEEIEMVTETWHTDEKITVSFESSEEKMFFFIQAIQLCWIDNDYVENEKAEIREVAKELGISIDSIQKVEEWVYEGIVWNRKSEELLKLK